MILRLHEWETGVGGLGRMGGLHGTIVLVRFWYIYLLARSIGNRGLFIHSQFIDCPAMPRHALQCRNSSARTNDARHRQPQHSSSTTPHLGSWRLIRLRLLQIVVQIDQNSWIVALIRAWKSDQWPRRPAPPACDLDLRAREVKLRFVGLRSHVQRDMLYT